MHVAAVCDGASISIYVNGDLDATKSASGVLPGGLAPLIVGNSARTDGSALRATAEPTLIRAGVYYDPNPIYPAPNPADPTDIIVVGVDCDDSSFVQRVDAETGEMTLFPGPMSDRRAYWFEGGDRFAHVAPNAPHDVLVYDLVSGTSSVVNVDATPDATYNYLAPGNGGARIYALRHDAALARRDVVAIDLSSGAVQTLATGVDYRGISWAIAPFELDRDGDGLGNGIDPTPDG
jgi:hypothetical protein